MQLQKQILCYAEQKKLDRKEFILLWSSLREVLEQATLINVNEVEKKKKKFTFLFVSLVLRALLQRNILKIDF